MKQVTHSDNLCTVGMTCITALMDANDMRALLKLCPDGNFTPCFCSRPRIDTPEKLEYCHRWRKERDCGAFYFNFNEDAQGKNLLKLLFADGQTDEIGQKYVTEIILED